MMKKYLFALILSVSCLQTMELFGQGVVEGRVVDISTGKGIVGVSVQTGALQVYTDTLGNYQIPNLSGVVELAFNSEGYCSRSLLVHVGSDSISLNDVYLSSIAFSPISAQYHAYTNTASLSVDDAIADYLAHDVRSI